MMDIRKALEVMTKELFKKNEPEKAVKLLKRFQKEFGIKIKLEDK